MSGSRIGHRDSPRESGAAALTDREGHDALYRELTSPLAAAGGASAYEAAFRRRHGSPFWRGGTTKGYVRGLTLAALESACPGPSPGHPRARVLDCGSGLGELSVYLACRGFEVEAIDISEQARRAGEALAATIGVAGRCRFHAASLEHTGLDEGSIDFVIGHASLHHFIKYPGVPAEFARVMKPGAQGLFADSFGENRAYHLFHDKARMAALGDVVLTRRRIERYFAGFEVELTPTDWFTMLDKLYLRVLGGHAPRLARGLSRVHFALDRMVPARSRAALFLSGAVFTRIRKPG